MTPQEIYDESRAKGMTHEFALMCACRQPPGTLGTDRAFLEGRIGATHDIERQPRFLRSLFAERARGTDVRGKVYVSGLVRPEVGPGDPFAYVEDVAELKRKAAIRGIGGTGIVDIPVPDNPPEPHVALADDLVQEEVDKIVKANPGKKMDLREVRERVIDKHAPAWAKKKAKETSRA